ncbi:MAG: hypothetical protein IPM06_21375 [Rhizobiales bacterium]|nr:hypothetical protein [Hyphomicrobiales bacterium]
MTKRVRIENADTGTVKIVVQTWDKGYPEGEPDTLAREEILHSPCAMTGDNTYITSTRYLVIKEA